MRKVKIKTMLLIAAVIVILLPLTPLVRIEIGRSPGFDKQKYDANPYATRIVGRERDGPFISMAFRDGFEVPIYYAETPKNIRSHVEKYQEGMQKLFDYVTTHGCISLQDGISEGERALIKAAGFDDYKTKDFKGGLESVTVIAGQKEVILKRFDNW